jgi:putative photosynthetic complex assembly protein 2
MSVLNALLPITYAVFLWWFSTGIVMALYGRSVQVMRRGFLFGTLLLPLAIGGVVLTRDSMQPIDVYLAVTCGVTLWGWQVAGYYLGFVTGPDDNLAGRTAHAAGQDLLTRFNAALRFSIYHEVLVVVGAVVLAALTWDSPNQWALWMYLALLVMHSSAKLNVFMGVRNFRIELLPAKMQYIGKLLGKQSNNVLFPMSVAWSTIAVVILFFEASLRITDTAEAAGYFLVATMIGLGLLEHWVLMLPLPDRLWEIVLHHNNALDDESRPPSAHFETKPVETASAEALKEPV